MKVAVTYDFTTQSIFGHFGRTQFFKIYTVEGGEVTSCTLQSTNGQGHGALAAILAEAGVDALICGGIGEGAQNALKALGIAIYAGNQGSCDAAVKALAEGTLRQSETFTCSHHGDHDSCSHKCH